EHLVLLESDRRRLIPVTPAIETPLVFAWGSCLESVVTKRFNPLGLREFCPALQKNLVEALREFDDISPQQALRLDDELSILLWLNQLPPPSTPGGWSCGWGLSPTLLALDFRRVTQNLPRQFLSATFEADRAYQGFLKANRLRDFAEAQ